MEEEKGKVRMEGEEEGSEGDGGEERDGREGLLGAAV